jgi:hypothetical protein
MGERWACKYLSLKGNQFIEAAIKTLWQNRARAQRLRVCRKVYEPVGANLVKHAGRHRAARYLIVSGVANLCAIIVPAVTHAEPLSEFRARLVSGPALSDAERQEIQRLAPNAPQDKPHSIKDRRSYEEAIAPYVAEARILHRIQ